MPKHRDVTVGAAPPDFSRMKAPLIGEFKEFTDYIGAVMPALEAMGYEVTTLRVQSSLPPKAKLRLKSRGLTDPDKVAAAITSAPKGLIASSMVSSAAAAKSIQTMLHMGTAIIDVTATRTMWYQTQSDREGVRAAWPHSERHARPDRSNFDCT